jgi:hypothetical protein
VGGAAGSQSSFALCDILPLVPLLARGLGQQLDVLVAVSPRAKLVGALADQQHVVGALQHEARPPR